MKKAILIIVILAVVGVLAYKFVGDRPSNTNTVGANTSSAPPSAPAANTQSAAEPQKVLYLFHNPKDQDEGCRTIYAYADNVERDMPGRVKVLRPDVKADIALVDKYKIKVLPTILIASPDGTEQERFEGEGEKVSTKIKDAVTKLKDSK